MIKPSTVGWAWGLALVFVACGSSTPPVADLDPLRGMNALAESRFALARAYFAADLVDHPDRLASLRGLARAWSQGPDQSLEEAQAALEQYLARNPNDDTLRTRYVRNLLLLGDSEGAEAAAAALDSPHVRALLTSEARSIDDPGAAWRVLEPHLDSDPSDPTSSAILALAASLQTQLGNPDVAHTFARRAVELEPLHAPSWYQLGRLELTAGDRDAARRALGVHEALGRLARGGPDGHAPSPIERLRILDALGDDLPREAPSVRLLLSRLRLEAGFTEQALETIDSALDGAAVDDRLTLADLLIQRSEPARAEHVYRDVLDRDPANRRARSGLVGALLGNNAGNNAGINAGNNTDNDASNEARRAEARTLIDNGLALDPDLARYHLLRGRHERVAGHSDAARAAFERALVLAPWNVASRLELAELHWRDGDGEAARAVIDQAPEPAPTLDAFRRARGLPTRSES